MSSMLSPLMIYFVSAHDLFLQTHHVCVYPCLMQSYAILQCLGFHWPVVKGKRAPTSEAPVLAAAPHICFLEPVFVGGESLVSVPWGECMYLAVALSFDFFLPSRLFCFHLFVSL